MYVDGVQAVKKGLEAWQTLVHVCQCVIFGSPRRLNLKLFYTTETLDVWQPLPLLIHGSDSPTQGADSIIAALGRSDREGQNILQVRNWKKSGRRCRLGCRSHSWS
jgi:hypothetical protein